MSKKKQSVYIVTTTNKEVFESPDRASLMELIRTIPQKEIKQVYRAIPMTFQKVTTVRLIASKGESSE